MITRAEFLDVCDAALDAMVEVAESLGDDLVSTRLDVPGGNSVFGLVTHCVGVMGRWARTVNRGIVVPRDRAGEFTATGTVAQLVELVEWGRFRLHEDVPASADLAAAPLNPPADQPEVGEGSQGAVLLHVHEELAQHLGQMEVIRDVLLARRGRP